MIRMLIATVITASLACTPAAACCRNYAEYRAASDRAWLTKWHRDEQCSLLGRCGSYGHRKTRGRS